jgi:GNAT superfamily N-acetyltransferase
MEVNMPQPPVTFRFAERGEGALILSFIRRLAKYERMEDDVVATEGMLEDWLFGKRAAEVVFASIEGAEVGFALFFQNFSTFMGRAGMYLEDVFVLPEYRGRGVGTAMLGELARICAGRGYGRFELSCLDWNAPSVKFYRALGAEPMSEWTVYRFAGAALENLASK